MRRTLTLLAGGGVFLMSGQVPDARLLAGTTSAPDGIELAQDPHAASARAATIARYCTGCHNPRVRSGGLDLQGVDAANPGAAPALWEKVIAKLRGGSMPPAGLPRPDAAARQAFVQSIESDLDRIAAAAPNPGLPTLHRLNRTEYGNAIRDLLAVDVDASALLPADDAAFGFDNNADALTVSRGLLERYMAAARKISRLAVGDPGMRPISDTYQVSPLLSQDERVSDDLPFGSRGGIAVRHHFPLDGEYELRIRLQRVPATGAIRGLGVEPQQVDVRLDGTQLTAFSVGGSARPPAEEKGTAADDRLVIRFPARAGTRMVGVSLMKGAGEIEGVGPSRLPTWTFSPGRAVERMGIDQIQLEGPHDATGPGETPSRARIFTCRPGDRSDPDVCARAILSSLARRALRRPVRPDDVDALVALYRTGRGTRGFESGIQAALEGLLVDPEFLFRVERDRPGAPRRLDDVELASRLSFFLWSSIPDEELLNTAAEGRLKEPSVLDSQIRRMLNDERSFALVTDFAAQWLHLRNMRAVSPYVNGFPEFDDNLRLAFVRETELFLNSQIRENRRVPDLLDADYTYMNERLARHYGVPGVTGTRFRRVALADGRRAGLLGHGSILTVTSYSTRTSPVVRGKWILENLLGAPPPPPPPDVPALPDRGKGGQPASVRERLERHRTNAVCASCHAAMDPLGFALENFDAIGKWRDGGEGEQAIDASGTMPDGTSFRGPAELRRVLAARREDLVRTITMKLLTYALGRGLEPYDMPAVRAIMRQAAADEYRWSALVRGVVGSVPFQMRRAAS